MPAPKSPPDDWHEEDSLSTLSGDQEPSPSALVMRLGEREREVMSVLWTQGDSNVQQVSERLSTALAYTTVMTTLDRLFKKGFLRREKKDRAFIYSASLTAEEMERQRAAQLIQRFFTDSGEQQDTLVSCLVNAVHQYDANLLDQLESKIRSARKKNDAPAPTAGGGD